MFKEYFVLLLLAHVIGDFYFQTGNMSRKKDSSMKWVIMHSLFYWLSTLLILSPGFSISIFIIGTIAAASHAVIDILKYLYVGKTRSRSKITAYKERNLS